MTEVPIEVGYRSYIKILRRKWDIVYHSKDLYFSHANKVLEPHYDRTTREYYGAETNPARLAIIKFIDQFRDGPGVYEPTSFDDLLNYSKTYEKRIKVHKPYRACLHQESHPSLCDKLRETRYQWQDVQPKVNIESSHPLKTVYTVEEHPYEKLIGRKWTHIFVPIPVDYNNVEDLETHGYRQLLIEACTEGHDLIVVEPILSCFYATFWIRAFWWGKLALKGFYIWSISQCCHNPHKWERNLFNFVIASFLQFILAGQMQHHPLAKYKLPDRFHDTEALNELKYFKEFVPAITHKVVVLFKDEEKKIHARLKLLNKLHFLNLGVLGYNYMFGISHWMSYNRV